MIDLAFLTSQSVLGRTIRLPLKLVPRRAVVRIPQGPLRGARWIVGASDHSCWLGCYESRIQRRCATLVRPGSVAYDLGAHAGFYSLLFSRLAGPSGVVHAFEPVPDNLSLLRRHLVLNHVTNVCVHPGAITDSTGTVAFDRGASTTAGRVVNRANPESLSVPSITLDDFVYSAGHQPPQFLKMDVEGSEASVLRGMPTLLRDVRPVLLIAIHGSIPWRDCLSLLASHRYGIYDLAGARLAADEPRDELVALPDPTH